MRRALAGERSWEVSLQLHMALTTRPHDAVAFGHLLDHLVPGVFVKVPFTPDHPHCLLVARDLERAGVHVNVTSTFSARQVATVALLANATRTNVFMGRIEQGLGAHLLGEHVVLEAQRTLRNLRDHDAVETELIVASMRDWRSFERLAGCDVFTAPCDVLGGFLRQNDVGPEELRSRLDTIYEPRVSRRFEERVGRGIDRLHHVEPEFLEFLRDLRRRPDFWELSDGAELFEHFDAAGFADVFHDPTEAELGEARLGKLPRLDGRLLDRIPLDTHYSILANEDFRKHQEAIDARIEERLSR
jgi:transaldolase